MKVLVTGAAGFLGTNLCIRLSRIPEIEVLAFDVDKDREDLFGFLAEADLVVHLAGINRPLDPAEYLSGNLGLSSDIASWLEAEGRSIPLVFSSSTQAELDNEYGRSKRAAEDRLALYAERTSAAVSVFRFANLFGKWCRPNYNSAVATFCHNIARDLPISIRDPDAPLRLVYVDDAVEAIVARLAWREPGFVLCPCEPVYSTTVGSVANAIRSIHEGRRSGLLPDLSDPLLRKLYTTYISYVDSALLPKQADMKSDERGWLFELVKSASAGQIFVSITKPGKRRGNHYHDTKVEKFCLMKGKARISLRKVSGAERIDFDLEDSDIRIVDIPPGYTHNIVNTGDEECMVIFWASEIFDPARPDTYFLEV